MTTDELAALRSQLIAHEGLRLRMYQDSLGIPTIGVGRNLRDKGLTNSEAMLLLDNDITECVDDLVHAFPWFLGLDVVRQRVLIDLRFNLGSAGLLKFQKFLAAVNAKDYHGAAVELLNSIWAAQVGQRAIALAEMMRTGTTT